MNITIDQIQALRQKTGISTMSCKKALEECQGDEEAAITLLRKKGEAKALERSERSTNQGVIGSYIHSNNKIGAIVKLLCETDFVARNEEFQKLAKDLAMHVTANNPRYLAPSDVSEEELKKEREIWVEQLKKEGKPEKIVANILQGKEKKYREENALLTQPFIKNPEVTIEKLITAMVTKVGENIKITDFVRYSI